MKDLINRDHAARAIEAYLCNQCDHDTDRDPECIACPHLDGTEILKSVSTVNRWIPCSERMPEIFESVLIVYLDFEGRNTLQWRIWMMKKTLSIGVLIGAEM